MNVSACLVTRGDVDMQPVLDSLPDEWEIIVWDNGALERQLHHPQFHHMRTCLPVDADLAVYGRYEAIQYAAHDLIYVQDDDVIVSDPEEIARSWWITRRIDGYVVCNQPERFRHDFYADNALVGFGACFHRDAPKRAFDRFRVFDVDDTLLTTAMFERTCDIVFTGLTPRLLVDVEKFDRDFATADDRMYRQAEHVGERQRMRDLVKQVRDAD